MAKEVNIKDVEVTEENNKKIDIKKIVIFVLIGIVSLIGIFFWSTNVRWNAEIEDYYEVLYYNQEDIKIESLKDFYGNDLSTKLSDNQAYLMYCSSQYGDVCVTGDFNNTMENLLRNPSSVLSIVILIDLLLVYLLLRGQELGKIKKIVIFSLMIIYGAINLGTQVYSFVDYYFFVNDSEYVANANVIKGIVTDNKKEYYPVVTYTIGEESYTNYLLVPVSGNVSEDVKNNKKITIYYDKRDNEIITSKKSFVSYILPCLIGTIYIVLGIIGFIRLKKEKVKE